ncbi:MAG: TIGR02757 family protein [Rubricoccaceae bacterium]
MTRRPPRPAPSASLLLVAGRLPTGGGPLPSELAERRAALDALADRYEQPAFIADDPIAVPRAFDDPADREVIGLFAALLAWGRRSVILTKLADLAARMDHRPRAFVRAFDPARDSPRLAGFAHRTFQPADAVALVQAVQAVLHTHGSLGACFRAHLPPTAPHIGPALQGFSDALFAAAPGQPARLRKHLPRPSTGSACKRLAMFVRWMVRPGPVDLGLWDGVGAERLILPLDVHTGRQARRLGLLSRAQDDWRAALELTAACRALCPEDPARYDFALFGVGAYGGRAPGERA